MSLFTVNERRKNAFLKFYLLNNFIVKKKRTSPKTIFLQVRHTETFMGNDRRSEIMS